MHACFPRTVAGLPEYVHHVRVYDGIVRKDGADDNRVYLFERSLGCTPISKRNYPRRDLPVHMFRRQSWYIHIFCPSLLGSNLWCDADLHFLRFFKAFQPLSSRFVHNLDEQSSLASLRFEMLQYGPVSGTFFFFLRCRQHCPRQGPSHAEEDKKETFAEIDPSHFQPRFEFGDIISPTTATSSLRRHFQGEQVEGRNDSGTPLGTYPLLADATLHPL